jgi:hypothetical protein
VLRADILKIHTKPDPKSLKTLAPGTLLSFEASEHCPESLFTFSCGAAGVSDLY